MVGVKAMGKNISIISSYDFVKYEVNYGSVFQYYALQRFLSNRGHRVQWIRYVNKRSIKRKLIEEFHRYARGNYVSNKICLFKIHDFIDRYLTLTQRECSSKEEIQKECSESEFLITGSDQVWGGAIAANFLTFATDDQITLSYAASFGKKMLDQQTLDIITPWLTKIDYISVREASGQDICCHLGRTDAILVPDPTLLIDKEDYPLKKSTKSEPYIFGYFLNISNGEAIPCWEIEKAMEERYPNEKLVSCIASGTKYIPPLLKRTRIYPSPERWLESYKNATAILTNSFHGTVFALVFRKPFVVFLQNGKTSEQNDRIVNLLTEFDLLDRIYEKDGDIFKILNKPIDWIKISKSMEEQREKAIKYFEKVGL